MRNGKERKLLSSSPVQQQQQLDCEVGLGLKMQLHSSSYSSCDGAPFLNASTNQPHIYDHSNGVLLHRTTLDNAASRPPYANYGGMNMNVMGGIGSGMYGGGKGSSLISSVFTRSQLQELEKQKMIHKYILANIPVPSQLLLSSSSSSSSSLSQCNTVLATSGMGMDMRYGGGNGSSDPEPWRCKRTDGKKWRCSRDVAGDQKYCERHAHKNRPRSRKHVEPNKPPSSSSSTITNTTPPPQLQRSSSQFPYDQTRCIEWLMRGGIGIGNNSDNTNPLSLSNNKHQQWDQMMQQNSAPSSKINYDDHNDHVSVYHPQFAEKQAAASYMDDPDTTQATTRLFIDSWGKDSTKGLSEDKKMMSSSSLSLSMSSRVGEGDRDRDDEEKGYDLGIGMMIGMNHQQQQQWLNPISWINSLSSSTSAGGGGGGGGAPGGPLGEALCLGNGGMNMASASLPSPQNHTTQHGCCYAIAIANANANANSSSSNSNTNSSKSSCQDASHALNFIG